VSTAQRRQVDLQICKRRNRPRKEQPAAVPVLASHFSLHRTPPGNGYSPKLNLLAAAYRKIPILGAPPVSITYTRARTRAVYRKSIDELYEMLNTVESPKAAADRARLSTLGPKDKYLAVTKPHYDNVRANITYSRLDSRGRGRVQLAAALPPPLHRRPLAHTPEVTYHAPADELGNRPRSTRQTVLDNEPFSSRSPLIDMCGVDATSRMTTQSAAQQVQLTLGNYH
jgi:hypothetical protein